MAFFDGDRELGSCMFLHVVSASFRKPKRHASVMQTSIFKALSLVRHPDLIRGSGVRVTPGAQL
jgi:hypothetical protein